MIYTIIDVETTGRSNKLTEISIFKYDGTKIIDEFTSLVNPQLLIPDYITALTGIDNGMVADAPTFSEIAHAVLAITENTTFVAHNVNFDYNAIRNEFKDVDIDFNRKKLCTIRLSRKLIPGHKSYSLGKLCRAIGIPMSDRHRANGDALATVKLFQILLQKDTEKLIVKSTIKVGNQRDLSGKLLKILDVLPNQSGLFYFHRFNGDILYIGKGKNIQKGVNLVFLRTSNQNRSLLKEMDSVTFEATGSELIANIKFEEEVSMHKPKYNKHKKQNIQKVVFNHDNMILIDKGRSLEEKSVILIENNNFQGFAYTELSHQFNNLDILKSLMNKSNKSLSQNMIIKTYLSGNTVEKIIRF